MTQEVVIEHQLAVAYQGLGLSRSTARVYAYVTLSEVPVTAREIQEKLAISAGSVSEALSTLEQLALIRRFKVDGSRQFSYEIESDSWERSLLRQTALIEEVLKIIKKSAETFPNNKHLPQMIHLYEYVIRETRGMLERYKQTIQ